MHEFKFKVGDRVTSLRRIDNDFRDPRFKKLLLDYHKFLENSDYATIEGGIDDFLEQYFE